MVLASGPEMIEDVRKAPDDTLFLAVPVVEVRMLPSGLNPYS